MASPYLLDTTVLLHWVRDDSAAKEVERRYGLSGSEMRPLICAVSLGEMLAFSRDLRWGQQKLARLAWLEQQVVVIDLDDFVACFAPGKRHARKESERFKPFAYDEIVRRDKASLDLFWLRDEALENSANLPAPEIIAAEIAEDLAAALDQCASIAQDLRPKS